MGVLCQACDGRLHEVSPFHDRKAWHGSHFESIPPTITVDHMMQTKNWYSNVHHIICIVRIYYTTCTSALFDINVQA